LDKSNEVIVKKYGVLPYEPVWQAMKHLVEHKSLSTDEIWVLQHEPVYTKGIRCKEQPISAGKYIPSISVDRGGLMTYHGPGQLIIYCLINLKRKKLNIKQVVVLLEQSVINVLKHYSINANRIDGAPGIYLGEKKIASIGLRVKNQTTYHGLSVNFDMDLKPFEWINPCGFESIEVVQLRDLVKKFDWNQAQRLLVREIVELFDYIQVTDQIFSDSLTSFERSFSSRSSVPISIHSP